MHLRAATRGSPLALRQTRYVAERLKPFGVLLEEVIVTTTGDRRPHTPIRDMGGKGVFVKEVQAAVLDGRADIAVHSMKDLPSASVRGLEIIAVPLRANPHDALVGSRLETLREGALIATGSARRRTQLAALRPDLSFEELRGNVGTRLKKAPSYDAIVVAAAALDRLGESPAVVDILDAELVLPQVGQGALAIEALTGNLAVAEIFEPIDDAQSRRLTDVERGFLLELGGDCDLPVAAHAVQRGDEVWLRSLLASQDGKTLLRDERIGTESLGELGPAAARSLLDQGGRELLAGRSGW